MRGQNYLSIIPTSIAIGKSILRKWETENEQIVTNKNANNTDIQPLTTFLMNAFSL